MGGIEYNLKNRITSKPNIVKDKQSSYVIVGSIDHGHQIPQNSIAELINSLDNVVALKMEGSEKAFKPFHYLSTEILVKASVGLAPVSYFTEFDGEDIGQKLLKYDVPEELAEVYIPCIHIRMNDNAIDGLFDLLPLMFEKYKERFSFINTPQAINNFYKVVTYWINNKLSIGDLHHFSYDFEKFVGDVREFEFWAPDLKKFRIEHDGKIAVCCGDYHTPFIQTVLDGKTPVKPNWETHIDNRREDTHTPQDAHKLKQIYKNLESALNL